MAVRKVVKIDEERCDGCGQCATACAEGAIRIEDGKARLISDSYCDGLGACLGECPQDAITIEEREAAGFDEEAVKEHLEGTAGSPGEAYASCPGAASREIERCEILGMEGEPGEGGELPSRLTNWPVQLKLVPAKAPYFDRADLLIAADCTSFSFADFHRRFLEGRTLLIGCPKLDSFEFYQKKLVQIFTQNDIQSIEVLYMEVPCCFGLVHLVHLALKEAEKEIPLKLTKIGIKGEVIETFKVKDGGEG